MYRNSLKELQVDYIDYLLLHGVGMGGGMEEFESALREERHPRFPAGGTQGGAHPQPRILVSRRCPGVRPSARAARRIQVGFRADPAELSGLEIRQADQSEEYRRRISLRRTAQTEHSRRHHGTAAGRQALQRAGHHRRPSQAARAGDERGLVGVPFPPAACRACRPC